ncbi:MAG: MFS transporter [Deltaproteobacteria bacterium]|jgi:MFS family permease|nr:MFS transporter [Deltaproteobacteria bacterium]
MENTQKFKGWSILIGCFIVMFFIQGGLQTFAVFLPAIMKDTGFSLGAVAMISTVATVAAFLANMSIGPLLKRITAKTILLIGAAVCAAHFIVYSVADSLFVLYLGAAGGGISIGLGTVAPVSVVMNNWFVKKRATYMSVVIAGSMFGGAALMPLSGQLIHQFDWRVAYRILAAVVAVVTLITILFVITDDPARKKLKAYGADEKDTEDEAARESGSPSEKSGVTPAQARGSASFWLLLLGILLVGCSTNIENFMPAFWQSQGMSVKTSASIMGFYALITGICTILLGRVSDRLGARSYIILTAILFMIGTALIYMVGAGATPVVILSIIPFAAGAKKTSTLTPPLVVADAFGRRHYGAIIGYFTGMLQLGIAISNPIIGALHRSSGGYKLPFTVMAVLSAAALVLIFTALNASPMRRLSSGEKTAETFRN